MEDLDKSEEAPFQYLSTRVNQILKVKQFWLYVGLAILALFFTYQECGLKYTFQYALGIGGLSYFLYFFHEAWVFYKTKNMPKGKIIFHLVVFFCIVLASIFLLGWKNLGEMFIISFGILATYLLIHNIKK